MRLAGTPMQLASCVAPGKLFEPLPPLPFSFFHPLGMSERTRSIFLACALLDDVLAPAPATWVPRVRPTASSTVTITLAIRTLAVRTPAARSPPGPLPSGMRHPPGECPAPLSPGSRPRYVIRPSYEEVRACQRAGSLLPPAGRPAIFGT